MKPLFIFGTSGHAHDVADIADALGWRPVFVAREQGEIDAWTGADEIVLEDDAVRHGDADFAFGIGDNAARARVAARFRDSLRFPSLLHPNASFGRGQRELIESRPGNVVFAGARFTNHVDVGAFGSFNLNATISHDVEIGDFVSLSPGASVAGNVRIGEGALLGVGAAVNHGTPERKIVIGAGCTIGSGAVVIGDCEPNSVYVGVPARKIR
jgi:sugar O-acyltransferase (sialic acid O-acetyltransferase NeuD family)